MVGNSEVDLFGDPILPAQDGPGRPPHKWTLENSNKVLLAFASGRSVKDAAAAIGVSVPTLRQHYSSELAKRARADLRLEMTQLARLNKAAEEGNVAAEKELFKRMEKRALAGLSERVADRAKPKKPVQGKKEQQREAAGQVKGKFAPPPPPALLN